MIISSLLDTDLYKFTMQQAVWNGFPQTEAEYHFKVRPGKNGQTPDLRPFADEIRAEIASLSALRFSEEELAYLKAIRFIKPGYVDSLRHLRLDPSAVEIHTDDGGDGGDGGGGHFAMTIRGSWYQTILFEVPLLAIVNETYFRHTQPDDARNREIGIERLRAKCQVIRETVASGLPLRILEFGTRRRYRRDWQETVVATLKEEIGESLIGTSNVDLARRYNLKPMGTMAHEFLQMGQAYAPVPDAQKFAFEAWMQEYRGDLGIALSDVFGMDAFFRDFDLLFSKAYDGARHDSGDPFEWGEKLIRHYEQKGIDPRTKTAVFSDSLSMEKVVGLARRFEGRIRTQFGIGTNLTNDLGFEPLQIVIKMVRCNGRPVVKLSDSPGKEMANDPIYLAYVRQVFGLTAAADGARPA